MAFIDTGAYDKWRRAQEQARALDDYNTQKAALDQKYENKGLGGFLGDIVGGIGKTVGDVGKGVGGLFGTAGASIGDLVNSVKDGKVTDEGTRAFKRYWYGGEDDADAAAKAAGTSLNAATTLASAVLPAAGAGTAIGKVAAGTAANTAAGALGGVADELQQQGKDASWEGAANRALSGAAAGLATGGLNRKLGNATSKVGSTLLNNKLATSAVGRGALSGAVGGSVGAGTSAALAGQDVASAALQGGLSGAMGGAAQGGIMSAATKAGKKLATRWDPTGNNSDLIATTDMNEALDNTKMANDRAIREAKNISKANDVNNKELATSAAGQLRKKSAEKLLDQYGTIDKPMARSARALDSVQKVADAGFEKPADVEKIISEITGDNGKVTKLTRQLVSTAKPVNTFEGLDDLIDTQIAMSGLPETEAKAVRGILEAQINSLPSRREGSISYVDNAEDVFDIVKNLEKRSANLKGRSGNNYQLTTPERTDKAAILDNVANVLKDRIYEGAAPMNQVLTSEVRQDLINKSPKNKKWADYVDNVIMKAENIGELRNAVAPFVNMGKIIENQYMNYGTVGQRMGDSAKEAGKFAKAMFKVPIAGQIAEGIANSNVAKRVASKGYSKAADIASTQPNILEAEIVPRQITNQAQNVTNNTPNTQNIIGNYLGRTIGLQKADNNVTNLQKAQEYQNLEDMFANTINNMDTAGSTMGLDGGYGMYGGYGAQSGAMGQLTSQLNEIAGAMSNALAAGDMSAYSQLADMYSTAYKIYQTQAEMSGLGSGSSSSNTKLSKTQVQANAASDILDKLESMDPDFGYTVKDIPVLNLVNMRGNAYSSTADSLATQIGYMLSGANIKDDELQYIKKEFVPQPFDDEATRRYKMQRARSLIQQYQNTYTTDANNNYA